MIPFAFEQPFAAVSALFGVVPSTTGVDVVDGELVARFGFWRVRTPVTNVASVERSGPYDWYKVIGPARMSVVDRGLTFATTNRHGLCLTFTEPVPGIEPTGRIRHPGLTVTVTDPDGLIALLGSAA